MAGGAAQIDKATLGKEYDVVAVRHGIAIDLGFDVDLVLCVSLKPSHIDFDIKVADAVI